MEELFEKVAEAVTEYNTDYKPHLDAKILKKQAEKDESLVKLAADLTLVSRKSKI